MKPVLTCMILTAVGLWFAQAVDLSLQVQRTAPPVHPVNTVVAGLTVVDVAVDAATHSLRTRVLQGEMPFVESALNALKRWTFTVPAGVADARTSATFLFRPPAIYPVKVLDKPVRPWTTAEDAPALPRKVLDPGYPVTSVAQGAVILRVGINTDGLVAKVETISGNAGLIQQSRGAVDHWEFSPARVSGKAVPSTVFVVISFVRPT